MNSTLRSALAGIALVALTLVSSLATAQPSAEPLVRRVLRSERDALAACIAGTTGPIALDVELHIAADGTVGAPVVREANALAMGAPPAFVSCVQQVLARLRFPASEGALEARFVLVRRGAYLVLRRGTPPRGVTSS